MVDMVKNNHSLECLLTLHLSLHYCAGRLAVHGFAIVILNFMALRGRVAVAAQRLDVSGSIKRLLSGFKYIILSCIVHVPKCRLGFLNCICFHFAH